MSNVPLPTPIPTERRQLLSTLTEMLLAPGGRALLVGEPGIGKTTLMMAAVRQVRDAGATVLGAKGVPTGTGQPFLGLVDLFTLVTEEALHELPDLQREALEVALARRHNDGVLPPMALRVAVAAMISRLRDRAPVVLALDDLPLLDTETVEIVSYVLDRPGTGAHPLTVVATQRLEAALSGRDDAIDTTLFTSLQILLVPALGLDGLTELLRAAAGPPLSTVDLEELHRRSGGNPLWALETRLQLDGAAPSSSVPLSVAELLRARIRSLSPAEDELLTTVATLGTPTTEAVLAVLPGGGPTLVTAIASGLLRETAGRVFPAHPLLASAVLEDRDPWVSMQLHRRIAAVVTDVAERAYHLDRSCPPGPEESVAAALQLASVEVRHRGAIGAAVEYAERSLARSDATTTERPRRVVTLAEMLFLQSEFERAAAIFGELDLARLDIAVLDRALPVLLGAISATAGEEASLEVLLVAQRAAPDDPVRNAIFNGYLAEAHDTTPEVRRAQAEDSVRVLAASAAAPVARHRALGAVIATRLDVGEGLDRHLLAECAELEKHSDLLALNDSAAAQHGFYGYQVDDLDGSRRSLLAVIETAEGAGEDLMAGIFAVHLGLVELMGGRRADAVTCLDHFEQVSPWLGTPPPSVVKLRGLLALATDDRSDLLELLRLPQGPGSEQHGTLIRLSLRGIDAARHDDWETAHLHLSGAKELAERLGLRDPGRRHWLDADLIESQIALRRLEEADAALDSLDRISTQNRPVLAGIKLRLRGLSAVARGQLDQAEHSLLQSVSTLAAGPVPLEHGRSLLELARLLRRRRARGRAQRALSQALYLARTIGDEALAARIGRELGGTGVPLSRELLTPSERRIAASVARGLTNQQVATQHFISTRTVETHLSSIYRKLQVHSRAELANWVRDHPEEAGLDT